MSFLLALLALVVCGRACLRLAGLDTGRLVPDLALGWFVGGGWFATALAGLRLGAGIPYTRGLALAVLAAPPLAAALWRRPRADEPVLPTRLVPRPRALFALLVGATLVFAWFTAVHAIDTPTQTDDGTRVRAFTPVLALDDRWGPEARALVPVAGTVPTFVPSLCARLTGGFDPFQVNYTIVASLVALLVLLVSLGSTRDAPERGWTQAFALMSLPLFVYHCTTTYTDAILAMHLGAGLAFFLEYERTRSRADAGRALLLLAVASMVKREGALLALCIALPLLARVWLERRRAGPAVLGALAWILVPILVDGIAAAASVGLREAFPVVKMLVGSTLERAADAEPNDAATRAGALAMLAPALFRSGNAGMLYWILLPVVLARPRRLRVEAHAASLLALVLLLASWVASSVLILPAFSLDQSTIHRALMILSVPVALWVADALVDATRGYGTEASTKAR